MTYSGFSGLPLRHGPDSDLLRFSRFAASGVFRSSITRKEDQSVYTSSPDILMEILHYSQVYNICIEIIT